MYVEMRSISLSSKSIRRQMSNRHFWSKLFYFQIAHDDVINWPLKNHMGKVIFKWFFYHSEFIGKSSFFVTNISTQFHKNFSQINVR